MTLEALKCQQICPENIYQMKLLLKFKSGKRSNLKKSIYDLVMKHDAGSTSKEISNDPVAKLYASVEKVEDHSFKLKLSIQKSHWHWKMTSHC